VVRLISYEFSISNQKFNETMRTYLFLNEWAIVVKRLQSSKFYSIVGSSMKNLPETAIFASSAKSPQARQEITIAV